MINKSSIIVKIDRICMIILNIDIVFYCNMQRFKKILGGGGYMGYSFVG